MEDKDFSLEKAMKIWRSVFPLNDGRGTQISVNQGSLQTLFLVLWGLVPIPDPQPSAGTCESYDRPSPVAGSNETEL